MPDSQDNITMTHVKKRGQEEPRTIFVIVGRLHASLTLSKVQPILDSKEFHRIMVFRETAGFKVNGIEYVTLPGLNWLRLRPLIRLVRSFVEPVILLFYVIRHRPHLLNSYFLVPKGLYTAFIGTITRTPYLISVIGFKGDIDSHFWPKWFWRRMNVFAINRSTGCTTKGQRVNKYLTQLGVDQDKVFVYNGSIDTNHFRVEDGVIRDFDLIFVGHLDERKGPDRFLQIVEKIKTERGHVKALILGDGPLRSITEANASQMEGVEIVVSGYVKDTATLYKRSKIFVLPSRSEGLSTAMLEAMACGCVPVVSDVGCMTEAAIHGVNAVVVKDYLDINEFARGVSELLQNDSKRNCFAIEGRRMVEERYSVKAQGKVFQKILKRVGLK